MKGIVFGVETEYGLDFKNKKTGKPANHKDYILAKIQSIFDDYSKIINNCINSSSCQFLENGGRIYSDTGVHAEFATPECSSAIEIVKYLKAGHDILQSYKTPLERQLKESGYDVEIVFFADNKSLNPEALNDYTTHGTHENYCIPRSSYSVELCKKLLNPFLATRQIYSGAGSFLDGKINQKDYHGFVISPRAFFTQEDVGNATTSSRPMINTRDEPHAAMEEFFRLHIICGESNRSDFANWLKIGATALVILALCRRPNLFKDLPNFVDPLNTFQTVSEDCDPNKKNVWCFHKERFYMSAVETQKIYLEKAGEYIVGEKTGDEERKIIDEWAKTLVMLERNDEELEYMLDWKIKQRLFRAKERRLNAQNIAFTDYHRAQIDIKYHDINPDGIFDILEQEGCIKRLVSDSDIFEARTVPPESTRAWTRGRAIKACKELNLSRQVDWESLTIDGEQPFLLLNPFQSSYPELEKFLKEKRWRY